MAVQALAEGLAVKGKMFQYFLDHNPLQFKACVVCDSDEPDRLAEGFESIRRVNKAHPRGLALATLASIADVEKETQQLSAILRLPELKAAAETYRAYLQTKVNTTSSALEDKVLTAAKLTAMNEICAALGNARDSEQLEAFRAVFKQKRALIETRRDTAAMCFLKAVATFFSIGLAYVFGIWKVRGAEEMKQMAAMLPPEEKPSPAPEL